MTAANLRKARIAAGFPSATAAATANGWGIAGYRHHENGTRGFDADDARRYGDAFGADPAVLLGLNGEAADAKLRFAFNLRRLRSNAGLTLKNVADALGVHLTTVSKLEDGRLRLSGERLLVLAQLYGVDPSDIAGVPESSMPDELTINGVLYRRVA